MSLKQAVWPVVIGLLVFSQACGSSMSNEVATILAEDATETSTPTATVPASATATATLIATPTGTSSANAPRAVAAGAVIMNWTSGNHVPQLALNAQGQVNLFFQTSTQSGGYTYTQAQMDADGTWTRPAAISPEFQFLDPLTAVPDMSGRLCVLWSGSLYDAKGNTTNGLSRNCAQADGTWQVQAQPLAVTSAPAVFSPARAKDGSLQSVLVTRGGLFYSPITNSATKALTGTPLSGKLQVLLARLAIDSNGGYHAAWTETDGSSAFTVQDRDSTDGGKTWSPAQQIYSGSADNPASIGFQLLAGAAGGVHLAWDGDNAVRYSHWSPAGGWDKPQQLSGDNRSGGVKLAVTQDGLARAAWTVSAAKPSVVMRLQAVDGTWSEPRTVTPTRAYELSLVVDAHGACQVVWSADDGLRYLAIQ